MKTTNLILFLFLLLIPSNNSAQENKASFSDRFIQAAIEKDPIERFAKLEKLSNEGSEYERFITLGHTAKAAFAIQSYEKAYKYAKELLSAAPQYKNDWNYGNAIYEGHLVLGRIAITKNDINEAITHLILAGKTPGSPQLKAFGPDMSLANDLIKAGEEEVVIEYFQECKTFWEMNDGRLDSWIASIKGGGKPYFGGSLRR